MMHFRNKALLSISCIILLQSYIALAFVGPSQSSGIRRWNTVSRPKSKSHIQASIADLPSREKEEEEIGKTKRNFRLSNIVRQHKYGSSRVQTPTKKPLITQVHNLEDYKTHVVDVSDALVVVFFTAPWCRTCARLKPKMRAMAASLRDVDNIRLVQVPLLDKQGAALFQGLGVKSFPFAHLYHPQEGLVEERKINRTLWNEFQTVVKDYREGTCPIEYNEDASTISREKPRILKP